MGTVMPSDPLTSISAVSSEEAQQVRHLYQPFSTLGSGIIFDVCRNEIWRLVSFLFFSRKNTSLLWSGASIEPLNIPLKRLFQQMDGQSRKDEPSCQSDLRPSKTMVFVLLPIDRLFSQTTLQEVLGPSGGEARAIARPRPPYRQPTILQSRAYCNNGFASTINTYRKFRIAERKAQLGVDRGRNRKEQWGGKKLVSLEVSGRFKTVAAELRTPSTAVQHEVSHTRSKTLSSVILPWGFAIITAYKIVQGSRRPNRRSGDEKNGVFMVRVTILPIPSHGQDDRASEVSAASSEGTFRLGSAGAGEPSVTLTPERNPRGFSFRRLGTVMGTRKDDKKPGDRAPSPEKEKRSRPQFSLRRGTSSKNIPRACTSSQRRASLRIPVVDIFTKLNRSTGGRLDEARKDIKIERPSNSFMLYRLDEKNGFFKVNVTILPASFD
ncbi:MAG: hypothetical protein L6R40_004638 [Gallowayella cf. fulva]|nr:MAG: hypothetical protein L6R40_004638 [Xanthomendoza cf. fulva]